MDQRVCLVGVVFLAACSGSALPPQPARVGSTAPRPAASAASAPLAQRSASESERSAEPPRAPAEASEEASSDQAFLDNTRRTVALYREFIERAGNDEQYAEAVKRSRERIRDLEDASVFVRSGMAERSRK